VFFSFPENSIPYEKPVNRLKTCRYGLLDHAYLSNVGKMNKIISIL